MRNWTRRIEYHVAIRDDTDADADSAFDRRDGYQASPKQMDFFSTKEESRRRCAS